MVDRAFFRNRVEAGRELAGRLLHHREHSPVVLALPRGGVPVAAEIARALGAPLDLIIVRKIGAPWQPELAIGAIADGTPPEIVRNENIIQELGIDEKTIAREAAEQQAEIERRRAAYLQGREPQALAGRTAIVVDDGIATGATMRAALLAVRRRAPAHLVLAVPVAPVQTVDALRPLVDELVCLGTPEPFYAIGAHYADFHQVADSEVTAALAEAARQSEGATSR
jgi:predicted phosphoribosyltransferase